MDFSYYNERNELVKLEIKAGDKWEYLGVQNNFLNSIFRKIDDGKKDINGYREVSESELKLLQEILDEADGILNPNNKDNILTDSELEEIEKQLDEGKFAIPKRNANDTVENEESQYIEHVTHHKHFTSEETADIENNKTDEDTVRQLYIAKIKENLKKYHNYDERFPEDRYEVDVVFNGEYYESFVYDKELGALKKTDPKKLKHAIDEFMNENFDVINVIDNPVEFLESYRKKSGGQSMFSAMISSYKEGKLSSDKLKAYMRTLEHKFDDYERKYKEVNNDSKFDNVHSFFFSKYFDFSVRVRDYFEENESMQYKYENNIIDKEHVKDLQKFVKDNYNVEINDYIAARIIEQGSHSDYSIYEYNFEDCKNRYKNLNEKQAEMYASDFEGWSYDYDDVDQNQIKEMQNFFYDKYNREISGYAAAYMIKNYRSSFKVGYNLEKLKQDFLNGKIFEEQNVKDFNEYLDKSIIWRGVVENDSLETLEFAAQATEQEYGRYNFDIHKSKIADLARKSEKMIEKGEKELKVTKTNDKITIKNKSTGEVRVIDLNRLTSKLDEEHKQLLLDSISGFNKISLWEFAIETPGSIGTDVDKIYNPIAQYRPENDTININPESKDNIDSNALLHEMCHAMMSTIIDGKNTGREPLFKEFVETFKEEQKAHEEKRLRNGMADGGNYTYCAQNIHEFAAEAGCLWLSGKSRSEFTIATHFPKSYRLFIQLIEKIRSEKTGRSINALA